MNNNKSHQKTDSMFPVVKLDYNFNVIHCNDSGQPLLSHWNTTLKNPLPIGILERHPEIYVALKNTMTPDIKIKMDDHIIHCSVVPFPEAGYIGIYGYLVEYADRVHEKVTLSGIN